MWHLNIESKIYERRGSPFNSAMKEGFTYGPFYGVHELSKPLNGFKDMLRRYFQEDFSAESCSLHTPYNVKGDRIHGDRWLTMRLVSESKVAVLDIRELHKISERMLMDELEKLCGEYGIELKTEATYSDKYIFELEWHEIIK